MPQVYIILNGVIRFSVGTGHWVADISPLRNVKKLSTVVFSRALLRSPRLLGQVRVFSLHRPDRGQLDAVLATVKASPGNARAFGERVATASLDGVCARRLRARAGRDGETVLRSNRETEKKE